MKVIGIVGLKDSGKTYYATKIISKLRSNLKASQKIGLSTYINNINL